MLLCVLETVTENNSSFAYYYFLRPFCKSKPRLNFWCMTISDPSICSSSKKGATAAIWKRQKGVSPSKTKTHRQIRSCKKKTQHWKWYIVTDPLVERNCSIALPFSVYEMLQQKNYLFYKRIFLYKGNLFPSQGFAYFFMWWWQSHNFDCSR